MLGTWVKLLLFLQMITEFVNVCPFLFIPQEFVTIWTRGKKILHNHPPPLFFFSLRLSQIPVERRTPPPSSDVNVRGFTEENLEFMNHQSRQAHFVPALGNVVLQTNKTYMVFFLTCMNRRPVQFLKIRISNQEHKVVLCGYRDLVKWNIFSFYL